MVIFHKFIEELIPCKMKTSKLMALSLGVFLFGITQIYSQQWLVKVSDIDHKVQKHTIMEQFAPDLVVPATQRLKMKNQRVAETKRQLAILDTLDISGRKKRKLLRDLKYSPFSERLDKSILVNTEFVDAVENNK